MVNSKFGASQLCVSVRFGFVWFGSVVLPPFVSDNRGSIILLRFYFYCWLNVHKLITYMKECKWNGLFIAARFQWFHVAFYVICYVFEWSWSEHAHAPGLCVCLRAFVCVCVCVCLFFLVVFASFYCIFARYSHYLCLFSIALEILKVKMQLLRFYLVHSENSNEKKRRNNNNSNSSRCANRIELKRTRTDFIGIRWKSRLECILSLSIGRIEFCKQFTLQMCMSISLSLCFLLFSLHLLSLHRSLAPRKCNFCSSDYFFSHFVRFARTFFYTNISVR